MKLDRLLGILTALLQKDIVTAPELAKKFEVSRRTINRDIESLCMAGIPVVTTQGAGGGISIMEGFKLDKNLLTTEGLLRMIAKPVVIDLASHYKGQLTDKISAIKRAVLDKKLIEFDYFYDKGESHRRIEPHFVIFQWSAWYVFGFCLERQDWRLFKLTRLWNLSVCNEHFTPREVPPEKQDFNSIFVGNIKLVALFDESMKYLLIDTYGLDCFTETDEGLLFESDFTHHDYLLSWLLGLGDKVKVLEPVELIEDIKSTAKNILKLYK